MTTILPLVTNIKRISFFFIFLFLFSFNNTVIGQFEMETAPARNQDNSFDGSTIISLIGYPSPPDTNWSTPRLEYFWILDNGNFIRNTTATSVRAFYNNYDSPNSEFGPSYKPKVYTTSVYGGRGDEPTKMVDDINPITPQEPVSIKRTKAVTSGFLNLEFNHSEIVPGDTTIWVLSIKNPDTSNILGGQVYLFYNSAIQVYEKPIKKDIPKVTVLVKSTREDADTETANKEQKLIYDLDANQEIRYGNSEYDTIYINNKFRLPTFNIEGGIREIGGGIKEGYQNGLFWNFDDLAGGEEEHLFIEFRDADNIFQSRDSNLRIINFLAVLVVNDSTIVDSLSIEERSFVEDVNLNQFLSNLGGLGTQQEGLISPFDDDILLSKNIIDIVTIQAKARRAHDPNDMNIQTCSCPPESDGAQKLIFTVEFENEGDGPTNDVKVAIPLPSQIDPSSITGDVLAFHMPNFKAEDIAHHFSAANDTLFWHFKGLVLQGAKELGKGNLLTFGEFTFTALTTPGTDLNTFPEMQACIVFTDAYGSLFPVCTDPTTPEALTLEASENANTQEILSCQVCVIDANTCDFPIWLICLIIAVVIFAMWIGLAKKEE